MTAIHLGAPGGIRLGPFPNTLKTGVQVTILRREADGTVTVISLANVPGLSIIRNTDGTVTLN